MGDEPKGKTPPKQEVQRKNPDGRSTDKPDRGLDKKNPPERPKAKEATATHVAAKKREVLLKEIERRRQSGSLKMDLDFSKGLETKEQQEAFDNVFLVSKATLLPSLFACGGADFKDPARLKNLNYFKDVVLPDSLKSNPDKTKNLNPNEIKAFESVQSIAKRSTGELFDKLKQVWSGCVDEGYEVYQEMMTLPGAAAALSGQVVDVVPSQKVAAAGLMPAALLVPSGATSALKETPPKKEEEKVSPYITAGLAIAGTLCAVGIGYHIYKSIFGKSAGEEEGFLEKTFGYRKAHLLESGLYTAGATFFFGRLLGIDGVRKWLKTYGFDVADYQVAQFAILASHGKLSEAWDVLKEGSDQHFDVDKRMADLISKEMGATVEAKILKTVGKVKYDDFMGFLASNVSKAESQIEGAPAWLAPVLSNGRIDPEKAKQEIVLRDYFEKHKDEIEKFKTSSITVGEVLVRLDAQSRGESIPFSAESQAVMASLEQAVSNINSPRTKAMAAELAENIKNHRVDTTCKEIKEVVAGAKKKGIDLHPFEEAVRQRQIAFEAFEKVLKDAAQPAGSEEKESALAQDIANKGHAVLEADNNIRGAIEKLKKELQYKHGWDEVAALIGEQGVAKLAIYIKRTPIQRAYGSYLWSKYFFNPSIDAAKAVGRFAIGRPANDNAIIGREFKELATVDAIEAQKRALTKELDEAQRGLAANKGKDVLTGAAPHEVSKKVMYEKQVALLGHDLKMNECVGKICSAEDELSKLRLAAGKDSKRIGDLEKIIEENRSMIKQLQSERFKLQGDFLEVKIKDQRLGYEHEFVNEKGHVTKEHFEEMDRMSEELIAHRKQIDRMIAAKRDLAEAIAKKGGPTAKKEIGEIVREVAELSNQKVRLEVGYVGNFDNLSSIWGKRWRATWALFTGNAAEKKLMQEAMNTEANNLRRSFVRTVNEQLTQTEGTFAKGVVKTVKGKMKFYGGFIVVGSVLNYYFDDTIGVVKAMEQAAIDTLPVFSTVSDFYSAVWGEEYITQRKLDKMDRMIRAAFFAGSLLGDFTAIAKYALRLRMGYNALKEGKAVGKGIKVLEALEAGKKLEAAGAAPERVLAGIKGTARAGRVIGGLAFAGALGAMGYGFMHQPVAEHELSQDTKDILGDVVKEEDQPSAGTAKSAAEGHQSPAELPEALPKVA